MQEGRGQQGPGGQGPGTDAACACLDARREVPPEFEPKHSGARAPLHDALCAPSPRALGAELPPIVPNMLRKTAEEASEGPRIGPLLRQAGRS